MVANGTAPKITQSTEGASFEPSLRKKDLQKVRAKPFSVTLHLEPHWIRYMVFFYYPCHAILWHIFYVATIACTRRRYPHLLLHNSYKLTWNTLLKLTQGNDTRPILTKEEYF